MLTALDEVMGRSQAAQKKRGETQMSMFAPDLEEGDRYPEAEEFPERQLIAFEKETIGFYFSRHPLAHYQEAIRNLTLDDSSTLVDRPAGSEVTICGLVSGLKEITTKKGDRMAFLTLEDMKGLIEVILFPEVYRAGLMLLRSSDPVVVRGVLDLSDENQVKIKAGEIQPLVDTPPAAPHILHIRVAMNSVTAASLEGMKKIIPAEGGACVLWLHLTDGRNGETVIALSDQYRVDPSPGFQNTVQQLFDSAVLSLE
jgi:DNA polymerase-3 subunit alpha